MKICRIVLTIFLSAMLASHCPQANLAAGQSLSREKALAGLRSCSKSHAAEGCNEEASETLIGFYRSGDKTLLKPLLDAGLESDGALAESLGAFYADVLQKEMRLFLTALSAQPKSAQHRVASLAGRMDGSGMPKEMLAEVEFKLRKQAAQKNKRLSSVARLCLLEVSKANRD